MKNLIISGVVGLLFMGGGFFFGLHLAPLPKAKKPVAAVAPPVTPAVAEAIGLETLRKTTQGMMDVNQALQAREREVAAREKRVQEEEEELAGERSALDHSHDKFRELYSQFQQRLELVDAAEQDQLQRQVVIYNSMDPTQAVDLLRALDDSTVVRLFSTMEVKPLAKLVSAWKTKYPADSPRLLAALNGMGRVQPADKMTMPDGASASDATPAAGADAAPATTDDSTAAGTPTGSVGASAPAPMDPSASASSDASAAPAPAEAPTPAPDDSSGGSLAPPADASAISAVPPPLANDSSVSTDPHAAAATTPPAVDSTDGVATAKGD